MGVGRTRRGGGGGVRRSLKKKKKKPKLPGQGERVRKV